MQLFATRDVTYAADGTAAEKLTEQIAGQKVELRYVEDVLTAPADSTDA